MIRNIQEAEWELIMFNDLCEDKYHKIGRTWKLGGLKLSDSDNTTIKNLKEKYRDIKIRTSGFEEDFR